MTQIAISGVLQGKLIAVIGCVVSGHACAQNMRKTLGLKVIIGLKEGSKSHQRCKEADFEVYTHCRSCEKG